MSADLPSESGRPTSPAGPDVGPRRGRNKKAGRSYWPAALLGARILAGILSFAVLLAAGLTWSSFHSFESNVRHINAIVAKTAGPGAGPAAGSTASTAVGDIDGSDQNILLVGDDSRPANASKAELAQLGTGQDGGGVNTDTMMVLHIPANGAKSTVISFPRDSWIEIPGHGMNKLNAAFELGSQNGGGDTGGARLLISMIQSLTGLTIDHFVRVSLIGFYDIAQVLGPIKVCLKTAARDSYSAIDLPAGISYLNASQALSFVRQRHNLPGGDLDREVRQQYFLAAAFGKVATAGTLLNPFKLESLLSAVSSSLETDLSGTQLLTFAEQFQNLSAGNMTYSTIPILGTPTISYEGNSVSIVAVDFASLPGFIAKVVGPSTAYLKATAAAPGSTTVTVVNASDSRSTATHAMATLTLLGFRSSGSTTADTEATTLIEYPTGMEAQAKALAAAFPGAAISATTSVKGLTLMLGSDYVTAASTGATAPTPIATPAPARSYSSADCIS